MAIKFCDRKSHGRVDRDSNESGTVGRSRGDDVALSMVGNELSRCDLVVFAECANGIDINYPLPAHPPRRMDGCGGGTAPVRHSGPSLWGIFLFDLQTVSATWITIHVHAVKTCALLESAALARNQIVPENLHQCTG